MLQGSLTDTIVAISTPPGESGIAIVRLSGKEALAVADKIFLAKDKTKPSTYKTYTTHYGWIVEKKSEIIDEVILTVMRAPKSYTREDVVEINCHGGIVVSKKILELVLEHSCRLAHPGEFTKRAFLSGRIDISQAEAVLDIIRAKTDLARKLGVEHLKGGLSKRINQVREQCLNLLAIIEAKIDFPEDEIDNAQTREIHPLLENIHVRLKQLLANSQQGRLIQEGISAVICGRPNVGKSSLLNALLRQERSIVTSIAGTTRDTIEEIIDLRGVPLKIVDTAGIIEPKDIVEKKAVSRSQRYLGLADLVILVLDGSRPFSAQDRLLIQKIRAKPNLIVINKIDLTQKINKDYLLKHFKKVVEISCLKNKNIDRLEEEILRCIWQGEIPTPEGYALTKLRQTQLLKKSLQHVIQARDSFKRNLSWEFVSQDLQDSLGLLDEILGKKFNAELLERIFNDFCIGK